MNQLLLCIQSQDDVPVASYSGSSRRLQRVATSRKRIQSQATVLCISSRHGIRRKKSRRKETSRSSSRYKPVAKQLTNYEELPKLDVNCRAHFKMLKTTKRPAKERTQRTIPVGALQNTFEWGDFVSNGLNLNRGFIFEKNAIEDMIAALLQ
ncbi:hypothetical protein F511_25303 [Dorcoceras hygrometricum]|uniref:Uncharacterized protein n=1 Tax=Dorcoceras hygrometricum TaxID=472368 RepID=A0A2Z7CDJ8_9LAMI|nr:hypothetical protein F511_25303 [Dorcoceras hygrometricum]